jgi:hypothetical protein
MNPQFRFILTSCIVSLSSISESFRTHSRAVEHFTPLSANGIEPSKIQSTVKCASRFHGENREKVFPSLLLRITGGGVEEGGADGDAGGWGTVDMNAVDEQLDLGAAAPTQGWPEQV